MKMKRVTLGFSILALSGAFILSCKPEKNTPPVADTETQSAVFASFANYVASDIEMACSFMGENAYGTTFYSEYPGSSSGTTGTVNVIRDTTNIVIDGIPHDQLVMAWNSTRCRDGNFRDGSIFMYVPQKDKNGQNVNNRYCRDVGFQGRISFQNYKVNGWLIELFNPAAPVYLYNTIPTSTYNTANTKLTWRFAGKLKFTHPTDPINKSMIWDGTLWKTLENSNDPKVFAVSHQAAITWSNAVISYSAKVTGQVPQIDADGKITPNVGYDMTVDNVRPLVRDFKCSPDKVSGITFAPTGTVVQLGDEHHPFKMGVASFTVGTNYPRQIYYGNEGEPTLDLQCDNTGEVLIKGISYRVDFMK